MGPMKTKLPVFCVLPLLALAMQNTPAGAQTPATLVQFLKDGVALDAGQLAKVEKGQPVVKQLDTREKEDVAVFGIITINYVPDKLCLELKSLKMYTLAYRDLGIFQENIVNCFVRDIVRAAKPVRITVTGEFAPRGGLGSRMTATWSKRGK